MGRYKTYILGIVGIIILLITIIYLHDGLDYEYFILFYNLILLYICFIYYLDLRFNKYLFDHTHYITLPIRRDKLIFKEILSYAIRWDVLLILFLSFFCTIKNQIFLINNGLLFYLSFFIVFYFKYLLLISILICATQWSISGDYNIRRNSMNSLLIVNVLVIFTSDNKLILNYSPFHGLFFYPFVSKNIFTSIGSIVIMLIIFILIIIFITRFLNKWPLQNE